MQRRRSVPPGLRRLPAWLLASLLAALLLLLTLVGGCRPAAPAANATSPSAAVPDFIQVGRVYEFGTAGPEGDWEVVEIRPDGWIRVKDVHVKDTLAWINLSQVIYVIPK